MNKYPEYKDSGIEWLGEIPEHWVIVKSKYVFKKRKKTYNESDDTPVLSLTISGVKVKKDLTFGKSTESYIGHQLVNVGQIVFTPRDFDQTPILSGVSHNYGCISNLYLVLDCEEGIWNYFVNYFWWGLKYKVNYFKNFSHGMRFSFNQLQFDEILFLKPSLNEQQAIADYLDRKTSQIDTLIEKKQKQIELLKEQRQAVINQAVTKGLNPNVEMKDSGIEWLGEIPKHWEVRKVSRSFNQIGSGTTPKTDHLEYYEDGDIKWVITGDLNDGVLKSTSKKITQKAVDDCSALKLFPKGTLLIAMYGATIGKIASMDFEGYTNQACCAISDSPHLTNKMTFYWFLANKQNIVNMSYGGGQPNISQDIIKSLKISTPPIKEQQIIVDFLDEKTKEIDNGIAKAENQIKLLQEYRTALISEAVTGKIDVREKNS